MFQYKIFEGAIKRLSDGVCFGLDLKNSDYQQYLKDVSEGAEVEPQYTLEELIIKEQEDAKLLKIRSAAPAIRSIPDWATWTPQEAINYYKTNITDKVDLITNLTEAKILLERMAQINEKLILIICYLRDHCGIV